MEEVARQKLCALIARYGRSLVDEPGRCESLLRDVCGAYRREIAVLVSALKEGVAAELHNTSASVPSVMLLARLTQRLQDQLGLAAEAARWAVESWALALGRLSPQEIARGAGSQNGSKAQEAPPHTPSTPAPSPPLPSPSPSPAPGARTTVPPAAASTQQRRRKRPALMGVAVLTAVIAAIAAGIGLEQPDRRVPEATPIEVRRPQLDGRWRLRWRTVDGALYDSTLDMQGTSGTLLTTYQHSFRGRQQVWQTIQLESLPVGAVLAGSNPRDGQTRRPVSDYEPDNFLLIPQPDGSIQVVLCDALALRIQNPALCVSVAVARE